MISFKDELYSEIRDKNFNGVGPTLAQKAKSTSQKIDVGKNEAQTVKEIKEFVDQVPGIRQMKKSLNLHITLAEMVKEKTDQRLFLDSLSAEQELLNLSVSHNVQWTPLIVATSGTGLSGRNNRWLLYPVVS